MGEFSRERVEPLLEELGEQFARIPSHSNPGSNGVSGSAATHVAH
jgi:hypothetical protein